MGKLELLEIKMNSISQSWISPGILILCHSFFKLTLQMMPFLYNYIKKVVL